MTTVIIRDAQHEEIDALIALLKQLFAIESDFAFDARRHRRGLEMMLDGCGKHRCLKVAEAGTRVVGMGSAQMLISTAEGGFSALLEDIVVDAPWRGRGIGHRLMAALEGWVLQHGGTRLQLLADRTNFSALDFYRRNGWLPTRMVCIRRRMGAI